MIHTMKMAEISFPQLNVHAALLHKVRGYFGREFLKYELLHNHQSGTNKVIYRYPAIQFKSNSKLSIAGYGPEAIAILREIFLDTHTIDIDGEKIAIKESQMIIKEIEFGEDGNTYDYEFISPWVALNQRNYSRFSSIGDNTQRNDMLNSILINNIISFCKFAGYTVKDRLRPNTRLSERQTDLKGKTLMAFDGEFKINFLLPDDLGLGKSTSRGYGNIIHKKAMHNEC